VTVTTTNDTCADAKVFRHADEGYPGGVHHGIEGFDMPAADDVRRAADALRMLADPTRLNILWALMQGETSVACLADLAGTTPTAVSQHLSKLRLAGLVTNRRAGTFVYYTLADDHIGELVRQALSHADHHAAAPERSPR
jgi:DNA-binding transcriptional ArsR family regulator